MLVGSATILGVFADFISVQDQLRLGVPWWVWTFFFASIFWRGLWTKEIDYGRAMKKIAKADCVDQLREKDGSWRYANMQAPDLLDPPNSGCASTANHAPLLRWMPFFPHLKNTS
jgi:hypothetical protein